MPSNSDLRVPPPAFLLHLSEVMDVSLEQATRAFGAWLLTTEAGQALVASFEPETRNRSNEAA